MRPAYLMSLALLTVVLTLALPTAAPACTGMCMPNVGSIGSTCVDAGFDTGIACRQIGNFCLRSQCGLSAIRQTDAPGVVTLPAPLLLPASTPADQGPATCSFATARRASATEPHGAAAPAL